MFCRLLPLAAVFAVACTLDPLDEPVDDLPYGWDAADPEDGQHPLPPPGLSFNQEPLVPGDAVRFRVTGAAPGDLIHFVYSTTGIGQGPCIAQLGGLCLDLLPPVTDFGQGTADAAGAAILTVQLPPNTPEMWVFTQAVVDRGMNGSIGTNTITAPVLSGSLDLDGDGYCGGDTCADPGSLPGDCHDNNAAVHPGVISWSDVPYWDGNGWSYDFDCDGVERKQLTDVYDCTPNGGFPTCPHTDGFDQVPACGDSGLWQSGCLELIILPICEPTGSFQRTQRCN